jgi:regulator of protease activity HflC (stomatin/prohibitin superfamily)
MALVIVGIAVAVLLVVWVVSAVRVVRPYERGVVERVGRYRSTLSPGLRMMMPLVDTVRMVDMREQVLVVAALDVITKDNVTAGVDAAVFYAPTDPEKLVYSVANFTLALGALTQAGLRSALADLPLDDALTGQGAIGTILRTSLDEATVTWGVQVRRVEIQRVEPPAEVIAAMQEQTTAERRRMALVTEADGERQAAIARAEGEHQARIFEAEAEREARALRAQGEAAAMRTMADAERYRHEVASAGQATAIKAIDEALRDGQATTEVLAVRYIEALRELSTSPSTKIVVPGDPRSLMSALAGLAELFPAASAATGIRAACAPLPPPPSPAHAA